MSPTYLIACVNLACMTFSSLYQRSDDTTTAARHIPLEKARRLIDSYVT
jgi:hypothetical protein